LFFFFLPLVSRCPGPSRGRRLPLSSSFVYFSFPLPLFVVVLYFRFSPPPFPLIAPASSASAGPFDYGVVMHLGLPSVWKLSMSTSAALLFFPVSLFLTSPPRICWLPPSEPAVDHASLSPSCLCFPSTGVRDADGGLRARTGRGPSLRLPTFFFVSVPPAFPCLLDAHPFL